MAERVVFLFDVDNTLLNNDHVIADLHLHVSETFAVEPIGGEARVCCPVPTLMVRLERSKR